jgi:hypothetical protein
MGMDVNGNNPSAEVGVYFRNNVWWWHPLWDYVTDVAPELTEGVFGHSNDGDGPDGPAAERLAAILTEELEAGRTAEYQAAYMAKLAALPDEVCSLCSGTGVRTDAVGVEMQMPERKWCNGCQGKGKHRPFEAIYSFSAENVAEFRDFVAASGGFKIW